MTREEALKLLDTTWQETYDKNGETFDQDTLIVINKIYDDFDAQFVSDEHGYIPLLPWAGRYKPNTKYSIYIEEEEN